MVQPLPPATRRAIEPLLSRASGHLERLANAPHPVGQHGRARLLIIKPMLRSLANEEPEPELFCSQDARSFTSPHSKATIQQGIVRRPGCNYLRYHGVPSVGSCAASAITLDDLNNIAGGDRALRGFCPLLRLQRCKGRRSRTALCRSTWLSRANGWRWGRHSLRALPLASCYVRSK